MTTLNIVSLRMTANKRMATEGMVKTDKMDDNMAWMMSIKI